jgi:polysaccharide biosynthesis protein PelA
LQLALLHNSGVTLRSVLNRTMICVTPSEGIVHTSSRTPLVFYYGKGNMSALTRFDTAILQPSHYTPLELGWLKRHGVTTLAFLDLSKDNPKARQQQRVLERSSNVSTQSLLEQVKVAFDLGFEGLFVDSVDVQNPAGKKQKLELLQEFRKLAGSRTVLVNRGFSLMPDLLGIVNGIVFEAFSTQWNHKQGYALLPKPELAWSAAIATQLRQHQTPVYALDYADTIELKHFARRRAEHFGFTSLIANRELTQL